MNSLNAGIFEDTTHLISYRVYYEDTDSAGVVYYANYLKFAERARTEALRALGINQSALMADKGIGFVVRHIDMDFLKPLRLDDIVVIETSLQELRKVRMTMRQIIKKGSEPCASLTVTIACVDRQFRPAKMAENVMSALSSHFGVTHK